MTALTVIGDSFLDVDIAGTSERLSPDGPVPVIEQRSTTRRGGGAALTAAIAARAGAATTLVTALGQDRAGEAVRRWLAAEGVDVVDVGDPHTAVTGIKTRLRVDATTVTRLDRSPRPERTGVRDRVTAALSGADAVLASDYGLGLLGDASCREVLPAARRPVVWDPHRRGADPVAGAAVLTPNVSELAALVPDGDTSAMRGRIDAARRLRAAHRSNAVALTCGPEGMLLVEHPGTPPLAVTVDEVQGDACGAGDCFAAELAVGLAMGRLPSEAATRAVHAASRFVAAGGAAAWGASAGRTWDEDRTDGIALARRVRAAGGVVVATGGCFDLVHVGHVELLRSAARLGDCLIVCMNSDSSVAALKGPDRPVVRQDDRAAVLRAIGGVDDVIVFDESTPVEALRRIRPHVFVKGGDYHSTVPLAETAAMAEWGGEVVVVPYVSGRSTTSLIGAVAAADQPS